MKKLKESLSGVDERFTSVLLYVLHERLRRMQSLNVWTDLNPADRCHCRLQNVHGYIKQYHRDIEYFINSSCTSADSFLII